MEKCRAVCVWWCLKQMPLLTFIKGEEMGLKLKPFPHCIWLWPELSHREPPSMTGGAGGGKRFGVGVSKGQTEWWKNHGSHCGAAAEIREAYDGCTHSLENIRVLQVWNHPVCTERWPKPSKFVVLNPSPWPDVNISLVPGGPGFTASSTYGAIW